MTQSLLHTSLSALDALKRHPKRITAALAAVFVLGGGAAFAVANGETTISPVEIQQITHTVQAGGVDEQMQALQAFSFELSRQETTRASDTSDVLLSRLGVVDAEAVSLIRRNKSVREALLGTAGRTVTVSVNERQQLTSLQTRWINGDEATTFSRLVIERDDTGLNARVEKAPLTAATKVISNAIRTDLFSAMDDLNVPDSLTEQIAEIYSGVVDFHRSVRRGDGFTIVYEVMMADGEIMRTGRVLSAELVNRGRRHRAMWFEPSPGKGGYYTADGKSLKRSYTVAPLEFTRKSSNFGSRSHPLFNYVHDHKGVDYAAPSGTPVRTVGDGVVTFAGVQGGYGNVIYIDHGQNQSTVYAHLSAINVNKGQKVTQSQNIGAVGSTGNSTGPHLHFEFRINNEPNNPEMIAEYANTLPIPAELQSVFKTASAFMGEQIAAAKQLREARFE